MGLLNRRSAQTGRGLKVEKEITIVNRLGLHARPAAMFVRIASRSTRRRTPDIQVEQRQQGRGCVRRILGRNGRVEGLPEVDRGALGAATHLARLVPQHKMRAMVYTSATATAQDLYHFGSVLQVVERTGRER